MAGELGDGRGLGIVVVIAASYLGYMTEQRRSALAAQLVDIGELAPGPKTARM